MEWNYESLGFNTQEEMDASIERAQRAKTKSPDEIQQGIDNMNRLLENIGTLGILDVNAIAEGARVEALDKEVLRRMYWEEQDQKTQKRTDEINALLKKAGESSKAEREAKAAAAIEQEKAEALKAIEDKNRKQNNVFVDPLDDPYRALLKGLKGE